jgi:exopolyphosphatase/pppGpp-phosphohydrolase
MDTEAESATRARGRPRKAAPETPEARIARLQAELRQAEQALQDAEARRVVIVGTAALRHAAKNPAFRRELAAMLRVEVTKKAELAAVAGLLVADGVPPAPPV